MKFNITVLALLLFAAVSFGQSASVSRQPEFSDIYPDGNNKFEEYGVSVNDSTAYLTTTDFSGPGEKVNAVKFTLDIKPSGATITGYDKVGVDPTYLVNLGPLVLENVIAGPDGFTKYYYCCRANENHITVYRKPGVTVSFDYLKPGGYLLSVGSCYRQ